MTRVHAAGRAAFGILTLALVASGCGWILGLDEFTDAPPPTEGTGGQGGGCEPGAAVACYEGPEGTEGVGVCAGGTTTCGEDGTAQGVCEGQVTPGAETCVNPADEDCDGRDCVVWAKLFGDISDQSVEGVAVDAGGNLYLAGSFQGTLALDTGHPISANGSDIYVGKFDREGTPLWSRAFGGPSGTAYVSGAMTDSDGNVIITGILNGTIDFDGTVLTKTSYQDVYVAKLSPEGAALWAIALSPDELSSIADPAIDSHNNIVLFGNSECGSTCVPQTTKMWLYKLQPDGTPIWTKTFPFVEGLGNQIAGAVTVDPFDNILVTGGFSETVTLGQSPLTTAGGFDIFVAKFDATGAYIWRAKYGDGSDQRGADIASDALGNVILFGTYDGTVNFGAAGDELIASGASDVYMAKLSSAKVHLWSKSFGGEGSDDAGRVAVLPDGTILFTGATVGQVDYGGGALRGGGGTDIPLVKLDPEGGHLWSWVFGDGLDQTGSAVALTAAGDAILGAVVSGGVDVGSGLLSAGGGQDILLAQFAP